MNTSWRKFAPFGLYLALLAALAAAGLYIVKQEFNLYVQISLGVLVIGLAIFVLLDPQKIREIITGRQMRYGSNAVLMLIAFLGILIAINWIVYNNPKRWDLTENKDNTLAAETLNTLGSLTKPVTAEAFFTKRTSSETASKLLQNYKANSKGNFDFTFIDPEADPIAAQNAKITRDGSIVLKLGDRSETVTFAGEQDLTSAIIRLTNPGTRAVYFLSGHGEVGLESSGDAAAFGQVKQMLESKNYTVKSLNLLATSTIPEDALAIIIAGPKKPLSQAETDALKAFLDKGKGVIYMGDPTPLTQFNGEKDVWADYLKTDWGIILDNDLVVDPNVNPPTVAVAESYGQHAITSKMSGVASVFPTARTITKAANAPQDLALTPLVLTAQNAWGETDIENLKNSQVAFDATKDVAGPVTLAIVGESSAKKSRLVVFGDSDFASDTYANQYGNADLLVNTIDWSAGQDSLINLTPKQQTNRSLIPPQEATLGLVLLGSVFVLPLVVIALGISVWLQRRRKG
jgi:ABC-type uncharacterized transport system involved in gliding motility auxiliary subunit